MMTRPTEQKLTDPIAAFVTQRQAVPGAHPASLVSMEIDVILDGGLAVVETKRTYRNSEKQPIEALLTFPVPVHATFFGLVAEIGGRELRGIAQAREEANETYEDAIDAGKAAVLHEEVLRGVHSLSVANLASGTSVSVTTRWAEALRFKGATGHVRVPMTVGDVYGMSALPDHAELSHGAVSLQVPLRIRYASGTVSLAQTEMVRSADGSLTADVPSNVPIDIHLDDFQRSALTGKSWEGRDVSLRIEPTGAGEDPLDLTVLVDHSGSMDSVCASVGELALTKHGAVKQALLDVAGRLRPGDRVALWEFDHRCNRVGRGHPVPPGRLAELVGRLAEPSGGTEIGGALDKVLGGTETRDIVLITDGLSYSLDVQRLANSGRRISVALVGEDSLEAMVGHLAALTGGQVHCSFGDDVGAALDGCLQGLRAGVSKPELTCLNGDGRPEEMRLTRGNALIQATWGGAAAPGERDLWVQGVAAHAAGLAIGSMDEAAARRFAINEGLVTHLTSLVLVDHDGERTQGLPMTRKVHLPTPSLALSLDAFPAAAYAVPPSAPAFMASRPCLDVPTDELDLENWMEPVPAGTVFLADIARKIDWNAHGSTLSAGLLDGLESGTAEAIRQLAAEQAVEQEARRLQITPLLLAIAMIAGWADGQSRQANRVQRRILRSVDRKLFGEFAEMFGPAVGPLV